MTTITAKNGTKIALDITGTQEAPAIIADAFTMQGKNVGGVATLQHWRHKGAEEGLFFRKANVYVQCAAAMPTIRAAIAELPPAQYWARKTSKTVDADGDICTVDVWKFDKTLRTEAGTIISESEMEHYLNSKGITEIEIADAVKMWAGEREGAKIKANKEGNLRADAVFDADVAEVGYAQACENAGSPREVR